MEIKTINEILKEYTECVPCEGSWCIDGQENIRWVRVDDINKKLLELISMIQLNVSIKPMNASMYKDKVQEYRQVIYDKAIEIHGELSQSNPNATSNIALTKGSDELSNSDKVNGLINNSKSELDTLNQLAKNDVARFVSNKEHKKLLDSLK